MSAKDDPLKILSAFSISSCSESINEAELDNRFEDAVLSEELRVENSKSVRSIKRVRHEEGEEDDDSDWIINRKLKKGKDEEKLELYISCKELLPKQFAWAKLFKEQGISDIVRVKYINQYSVRVDTYKVETIRKIETNKCFIEKAWRFHRAMEKSYSYGLIRYVDLELSEEDIFKNISCPSPFTLISVHRLNRRVKSEIGWAPSESNKILCPKCGQNHSNCETEIYKCVNCSGNHMSLSRSCPMFKKEKKIREEMAEFNCTYRKALTKFIGLSPCPVFDPNERLISASTPVPVTDPDVSCTSTIIQPGQNTITFADVVRRPIKLSETPITPNQVRKSKKKRFRSADVPTGRPLLSDAETWATEDEQCQPSDPKREVHFTELLIRLKEIIFLDGLSIKTKVHQILKCSLEW